MKSKKIQSWIKYWHCECDNCTWNRWNICTNIRLFERRFNHTTFTLNNTLLFYYFLIFFSQKWSSKFQALSISLWTFSIQINQVEIINWEPFSLIFNWTHWERRDTKKKHAELSRMCTWNQVTLNWTENVLILCIEEYKTVDIRHSFAHMHAYVLNFMQCKRNKNHYFIVANMELCESKRGWICILHFVCHICVRARAYYKRKHNCRHWIQVNENDRNYLAVFAQLSHQIFTKSKVQ